MRFTEGQDYLVVYSTSLTTNYFFFPKEDGDKAEAFFRENVSAEMGKRIDDLYGRSLDDCIEEGEYKNTHGTTITLEHYSLYSYRKEQ